LEVSAVGVNAVAPYRLMAHDFYDESFESERGGLWFAFGWLCRDGDCGAGSAASAVGGAGAGVARVSRDRAVGIYRFHGAGGRSAAAEA
jgi:hypothetical protein